MNSLLEEKELLEKEREDVLENIFIEISKKASNEDFVFEIKKGSIKHGAQLYIVDDTPENFFVGKQLQRNIYKTFKVKQAERNQIIHQIELLLKDNFPKIVIRADIEKFYESIPHIELLSKIEQNSLLSI